MLNQQPIALGTFHRVSVAAFVHASAPSAHGALALIAQQHQRPELALRHGAPGTGTDAGHVMTSA